MTDFILDQKIMVSKRLLLNLTIEHWHKYELFTWQWWFKLVYMAAAIIIFYKLLNKKRKLEVICYGLMIGLFSIVFDFLGHQYILWNYKITLLPVEFFATHDLIVIPIASMLVYQFFSNWKSFVVASLVLSALGAFITEPLYILINIYEPVNWNHIYSFFIFFTMTVVCKFITGKLIKDSG